MISFYPAAIATAERRLPIQQNSKTAAADARSGFKSRIAGCARCCVVTIGTMASSSNSRSLLAFQTCVVKFWLNIRHLASEAKKGLEMFEGNMASMEREIRPSMQRDEPPTMETGLERIADKVL